MFASSSFNITTVDIFIREAFERIGIKGSQINAEHVNSAKMSANLALSSWLGKGPNSFTRKRFLLQLVPGQSAYELPRNITQVVDAVLTQPAQLPMDGSAVTRDDSKDIQGDIKNLFNYDSKSTVVWKKLNGNIGYLFNTPQTVNYISVIPAPSNGVSVYQFEIFVSFVFKDVKGSNLKSLGVTEAKEFSSVPNWIVIPNACQAFGILLTQINGAEPLDLSKVLLSTATQGSSDLYTGGNDRSLYPISYCDWMNIPNKTSGSSPTSYFVDTQIRPIMNVWPVPTVDSMKSQSCILYTAYQYPFSIDELFQTVDIPQRFFDAMLSDLAFRLCKKWNPLNAELLTLLSQDAQEAFALATKTDAQNVSLNINPDFGGWNS